MKPKFFLLPAGLAALVLPASAAILAEFTFTDGSAASTDTSIHSTVSDYDPRTAEIAAVDGTGTAYDNDSDISSSTETAFMRAENTPTGTSPVGNELYHRFSITVQNLAAGETLNLTSLDFHYSATSIYQSFFLGPYSDAVGYTGTGDKLATANIASDTGSPFSVDLSSANTVAGSAFTGLTNGQTIEFRFTFGDNSTSDARIQRLDDIVLNGTVVPEPSLALLGSLGLLALLRRRRA